MNYKEMNKMLEDVKNSDNFNIDLFIKMFKDDLIKCSKDNIVYDFDLEQVISDYQDNKDNFGDFLNV